VAARSKQSMRQTGAPSPCKVQTRKSETRVRESGGGDGMDRGLGLQEERFFFYRTRRRPIDRPIHQVEYVAPWICCRTKTRASDRRRGR
jgi:hypothetical protein